MRFLGWRKKTRLIIKIHGRRIDLLENLVQHSNIVAHAHRSSANRACREALN
jgi:hypothetical protein